jgi:hypothetical protein
MDDVLTESYAIWAKPNSKSLSFGQQLDSLLPGFVYYPEEEWATYNFRPPDNADLLGAWRTRAGDAFIFLLSGSERKAKSVGPDYRVLVSGPSSQVMSVGVQIASHKSNLEKIEKRSLAERKAVGEFNEEVKGRSIERFAKIVAIFAIIVNAFSLYLRTLPPPGIQNEFFMNFYRWLIASVHIGALALLLLIIVMAFAYLIKFGFLLLRTRQK